MSIHEKNLRKIRHRIVEAAHISKEGHIPSAFSVLEILYSFYYCRQRNLTDLKTFDHKFVMSKGHAAIGLYATLEHFDLIPETWLDGFANFDSMLGGHPDVRKIPSIEASTGSLGHGLPIAVGICLAQQLLTDNSKVFVLLGDGELNEGSNWESMLISKEHGLNNLVVVVDANDSTNRALGLGDLEAKFRAFGFSVSNLNGHDVDKVMTKIMELIQLDSPSPVVVIAKTIKGKGIRRMESAPEWHHRSPNAEEFYEISVELS